MTSEPKTDCTYNGGFTCAYKASNMHNYKGIKTNTVKVWSPVITTLLHAQSQLSFELQNSFCKM